MLVTIAVLLDGSMSNSEKLMALNSELCSMYGRIWLRAEKSLPLTRPRNCISAAGRTLVAQHNCASPGRSVSRC